MNKFLYDILRDKGSLKFSITKFISILTFLFFIGYMGYYLLFLKKPIDHTLIIELIGFMLTLLGFKNNWGISKINKQVKTTPKISFEATPAKDEEGVF